jgi:hypothetical protein
MAIQLGHFNVTNDACILIRRVEYRVNKTLWIIIGVDGIIAVSKYPFKHFKPFVFIIYNGDFGLGGVSCIQFAMFSCSNDCKCPLRKKE